MKKLSKIIVLVLSLAVLCGALVVAVSADDKSYDLDAALKSAVADANGMKTVKLEGDATLEDPYVVESNLTIDLGGYTLSSEHQAAFVINDENLTFAVIGSGKLNLDGMIVRASDTAKGANIIIGSDDAEIEIYHSGAAAPQIFSAYSGTSLFKNFKVLSEYEKIANSAFYSALFETHYKTEFSVDMTFDGVELHRPIYNFEKRFFMISVAGDGSHLTIKDSAIFTQGSGIFLGEANAVKEVEVPDAKEGEPTTKLELDPTGEILLFENSLLHCVADNEDGQKWGFCLEGYGFSQSDLTGVLNIKNSLIEVAGRPFYTDHGGNPTSTINLINTEARCIANNGKDTSEFFARSVTMNVDKDSKILAFSKDIKICFNSSTKVNVVVGTRVNDMRFATHATEGVTYPDGKVGNSDKYAWVYDPKGDAAYPYVLVEAASVPTTVPYYQVDYDFDLMRSNSAKENNGYPVYLATTATNYTDHDGSFDSNKAMEFNIKMGSLHRGYTIGNNYAKFVISDYASAKENTVNTVSEDGKTLTSTSDPYFILGGHTAYEKNKAHFSTSGTYTRAKVAVLDFDFGTDSKIGYPNATTQAQSRRTSSKNNVAIDAFGLQTDGTITKGSMNDFKSVTLNAAGEWNHMTVVFYTDPALKNSAGKGSGRAYYYLNGEYFGYTDATKDADDAYIMGLRFNHYAGTVQPIDAALCFDNVSFCAYSEYLFAGEADGTGEALGTYSHASYVTASPARKYITTAYTVGGMPQDKDINDALEYSESVGKPLVLQNDINSPQLITTNGTIITNGYNIELENGSISCIVTYDENGNLATLTFNNSYDAIKVNYYWYTGAYGNLAEMRDPSNYDKVAIAIGQVPSPLNAPYSYVVNGNGAFKKFIGWSTVSYDSDPEVLSPVTLSQAIHQGDEPMYVYPLYEDIEAIDCSAYVVNAAGGVVATSGSDNETKSLYKNLKDGQTLVLCADFTLNEGNALFDNPDITTGVTVDNDYTAKELEAMKEKSAKLAVDLNGYKWTLSVTGTIARVSRNTTLSVYSSRPGAYIYSRGIDKNQKLLSQRLFAIHGGIEKAAEKTNVYNAHINIGTVTVGDKTYSGSNLTINGGVILEGIVGDNSCSIVADGILAMRGINCSTGMIMTRYYDGEIIVKNSIFVAPDTDKLIHLYNYDVGGNPNNGRTSEDGKAIPVMTPYVLLENSIFVSRNTSSTETDFNLVEGNGDYKEQICLEYKNFITNGRLNSPRADRNYIGGGVAALNFPAPPTSPYTKAEYNRAMTLNMKGTFAGGDDTHIIAVQSPIILDNGEINDDRYFYVVDPGYQHLVPDDAAGYVVLPEVVEKMTCSVEDGTYHEVYIYDFEGNKSNLKKCVTGANPVGIFTIPDITLGNLILTHDGTYTLTAKDGTTHKVDMTTGITASGDLRPNYKAIANLEGFKTSLSLHADFGVNLYVPKTYADIITKVTSPAADGELAGVEKNYEGVDYTVYTVYVPVGSSADDVVFDIFVSDSSNAKFGTVIGTCTETVKIAEYCETVLKNESAKYTAEDRMMTWYAVSYANEAYKYFGGAENEAFASLLEAYADAKGEAAERAYENALAETGLSLVFDYATLKLVEVPEYVFIVKAGFAGTVTVTTTEGTYSFTVEASEEATKLEISGMKAYELAETVTVTAEGTIGTENVNVEGGQFNIATFAAYHTANAVANEASAKALDVIGALYDYVNAAEKYNTPSQTES